MLVFAAVTRKLAVISGWPWPGVSSAAVESSAATNTVRRTDREVAMSPWEVGSAVTRPGHLVFGQQGGANIGDDTQTSAGSAVPAAENLLASGRPSSTILRVGNEHERWTQAIVYPDMWADPEQDPREKDGPSPDGELATLQDYLSNYRLTALMKCEGLDAEQLARRSVPPSTMSLLGLLRHLVEVERDWRTWITPDRPVPKLYGTRGADFNDAVADQGMIDAAHTDLTREQAATDALIAEHPNLSERLGTIDIAVRVLLVHRIEEYARHCGHADLLRECVDGRVGQ